MFAKSLILHVLFVVSVSLFAAEVSAGSFSESSAASLEKRLAQIDTDLGR